MKEYKKGDFTFLADDPIEVMRIKTLFEKEEGTIEQLLNQVKPGDIFYDVGANIGLYTILAASKVGSSGKVYAFEPHVGNAHRLIQNVARNKLSDRVILVSCALHYMTTYDYFNYNS